MLVSITGSNNQFRVNIFFPEYEVPRLNNRRYRTYVEAIDYELFYDRGWLPALVRALRKAPQNLRLACIQALQELPPSYRAAKGKAHGQDGSRSFAGYKVTHEVVNLVIPELRILINDDPELAKFRGYFFHLWGTNLKTVGQSLPERAGGNPLKHIFQVYPIVPWEKQNPQDIFVDFAIEIFVHPDRLQWPTSHVTLLWNQKLLAALMTAGYRTPTQDAYLHSHIVGGLRARGRDRDFISVCNCAAYCKDKNATRVHVDNSHGTGFSPSDALSFTERYARQMMLLEQAWSYMASFGIRIEWRCNCWAAFKLLQRDPAEWLRRFIEKEVIVVHPTSTVYNFKMYSLKVYRGILFRQQQLSERQRSYESVRLLTVAVCYLIKGLVKRPDDMSSSRETAARLRMVHRAKNFGHATVQPHMISQCLTRLEGEIHVEQWSALGYLHRKQPGGARLKTSHAQRTAPESSTKHSLNVATQPLRLWANTMTSGDEDWVAWFVNTHLAGWLWDRFPQRYMPKVHKPGNYQGPLQLTMWKRAVADGVSWDSRKHAKTGFEDVLTYLIPLDWVARSVKGQWGRYTEQVIGVVRERIEDYHGQDRQQYAHRLQRACLEILRTWEYLPAVQAHRIWVLQEAKSIKRFMIHRNPRVKSSV
ncbi:capsular polysaccharide export protein [Ceratobasidium sp. AG-Ba]|nr:capsular polysaccharide export protein [Ceratobasidium sp. AG-Ba]